MFVMRAIELITTVVRAVKAVEDRVKTGDKRAEALTLIESQALLNEGLSPTILRDLTVRNELENLIDAMVSVMKAVAAVTREQNKHG